MVVKVKHESCGKMTGQMSKFTSNPSEMVVGKNILSSLLEVTIIRPNLWIPTRIR